MNRFLIFLLIIPLTPINDVFAQFTAGKANDNLYTINSNLRSANEAVIPISQSLAEWDINFSNTLISDSTMQLTIDVPDLQGNIESYDVQRIFYREYADGNIQWIGNINSNSPFEQKDIFGQMIINMIEDNPFGVVTLDGDNYEIYTDSQVGTRIAKVFLPPLDEDSVSENTFVSQGLSNFNSTQLGNVPTVSEIDVLQLLDKPN